MRLYRRVSYNPPSLEGAAWFQWDMTEETNFI